MLLLSSRAEEGTDMKTNRWSVSFLGGLGLAVLVSAQSSWAKPEMVRPDYYSEAGREHEVRFESKIRSEWKDLSAIAELDEQDRARYAQREIVPLLKFLFGPLTRRELGAPLKINAVQVAWDRAEVVQGRVEIPYVYEGTWTIQKELAGGGLVIPVPFNTRGLTTSKWKFCTDSNPEHQTMSFYWYFWDPERPGCDHRLGREFQEVTVEVGAQTPNEKKSYPEYNRMIRDGATTWTFAFGYAKDPADPDPDHDFDVGAREYQKFARSMLKFLPAGFQSRPILQEEYPSARDPQRVIGHRFTGTVRGVEVTINVVAAAGIDQMEIFAKSFAHDHDAFFAWMGHSRVGSGFDADQFARMLKSNPGFYSIADHYQLIYWGGCNSYSYYTAPFFKFKVSSEDPNGTKGLDIISNGLPSLFALNSANSMVALRALMNWDRPTSYQSMIKQIESQAQEYGTSVLAVVVGDEDNR